MMTDVPQEFTELSRRHLEAEVDQLELQRKLAAVKQIVDRCRLQFVEDGLYINTAGDSNVATVETTIDAEYTTTFDPCTVGVETAKLFRAATFGMAPADPVSVRIYSDPDEDPPLSFSCSNYIDYADAVPIDALDIEPGNSPPPVFDDPATATIPAQQFKAGIGAVDVAGGRPIRVTLNGSQVTLSSWPSDDSQPALWPIREESTVEGAALSQYSGNYLRDLAAALPPTSDVTLRLSDGWPMAVETGDGLRFVLAPRLTGDLEDAIEQSKADRNGGAEA